MGPQLIEAAAILAFALIAPDEFLIFEKPCSAYNAEHGIFRILRTALGAFKMRTQGFPAFPEVLRVPRIIESALNAFHSRSPEWENSLSILTR